MITDARTSQSSITGPLVQWQMEGPSAHANALFTAMAQTKGLSCFVTESRPTGATPRSLPESLGRQHLYLNNGNIRREERVIGREEVCALMFSYEKSTRVTAAATERDAAQSYADEIFAALPQPRPVSDSIPVSFWSGATQGGTARYDRLEEQPWPAIKGSYAPEVESELERLISLRPPLPRGRLLLWHGAPGTGKTYALRALAHSWRPWCGIHVIGDPDRLLHGEMSYLTEVLTTSDTERELKRNWRLVVLEDAGELLSLDAHTQSGQGLSRLLNTSDGLLGQVTNALFLITTNEPLGQIHPARTQARALSHRDRIPPTVHRSSERVAGCRRFQAASEQADDLGGSLRHPRRPPSPSARKTSDRIRSVIGEGDRLTEPTADSGSSSDGAFFGQVIRRRQSETQLSAAFALLLKCSPAITRDFLILALRGVPTRDTILLTDGELTALLEGDLHLRFETEKPIGSRSPEGRSRRVDLAIESEREDGPSVWVEVKWKLRHESSADQVVGYAQELAKEASVAGRRGPLGVVYLTDHGVDAPDDSDWPEGVAPLVRVSWREIADDLLSKHAQDPLAADFSRFLEEEGLRVDGIHNRDIDMLMEAEKARGRFEAVLRESCRLIDIWATERGLTPKAPVPSLQYWARDWGSRSTYAIALLPEGCATDACLVEWSLRARNPIDGYEDGAVLFGAGLTWFRKATPAWEHEELPDDLVDRLQASGFFQYRDDLDRLFRFKDPRTLADAGSSYVDQAKELAKFVTDTYESVLDALRD